MIISLIAAIAKNNAIGFENRLLWHLPSDLKYFKRTTVGHYVLMGRKTFDSIGGFLKGRTIIVVTGDRKFLADDATVVHSIEEGIEFAKSKGEEELFICGGEQIYKQTLDIANKMYLSHVEYEPIADTFFPEFDIKNWEEKNILIQGVDEKHLYPLTINEYTRKK